jgi:hypothetical protein
MKFSKLIIIVFSLLILGQSVVGSSTYAASSKCNIPASTGTASSGIDYSNLPQVCANQNTLALISNIVFTIIGSVSVLIIVLAGFKFITSSGKPEEVAKAKDTIIYAAVGLIVCVFAVTIVSFIAGYI